MALPVRQLRLLLFAAPLFLRAAATLVIIHQFSPFAN
jgi:hypothetical protein